MIEKTWRTATTTFGGTWPKAATIWLFVIISLGFAVVSKEALADKWRKQCTAVSTLAEIEYDSKLPVNVASDSNKRICVFYISLPPNVSADRPISKASLAFQAYANLDPSSQKFMAMLKGPELVEPTMDALLAPLDDERFRSPAGSNLRSAVLSRDQTIRSCAELILVKRLKFSQIDDVISCGLSEDDSRIIFEASRGPLSVSMLLPFE